MRRSAEALGVLLGALALSLWPGWTLSPTVLETLPIRLLGPHNTRRNDGYEAANRVSPIIPGSYVAERGPRLIGLQFIGDATQSLMDDHFRITVAGPHGQTWSRAPNVYRNGFVGWRLARPWKPGRYRVSFDFPGFDIAPPTWTVTVKSAAMAPPRPSDSARVVIDSLNTLRRTLGLDRVSWNPSLQLASTAHDTYLKQNGYNAPSFHMESRGRPGYTGPTPWARDMAFGWPSPLAGEVGIEWTVPSAMVTVVQDLTDTVYHRLSILSDNLLALGVAEDAGPHGAVVMDLGFGYRSNLPPAIVYPYNGQPGVPTAWVDIESPNPMPQGYGHIFGYPITADFPTASRLSGVRVWLVSNRQVVPVVTDAPGVNGMQPNQVGMVPLKPLAPNRIYAAHLLAKALYNNGSVRPVRLSWHFATGGGSQSVSATVESPSKVVIADMTAGSGVTIGGEPLSLYRRLPRRRLRLIARGNTNWQGLWTFAWKQHPAGEYEVVSGSDNAVVFWWGAS
ncbi:MAG: CAP domain-containing protein [Firmicutes bacterium]|nr:CAP domain-containing protein [Bacillota bacterium]